MRFPGVKGQFGTRDLTFRADGTIASISAPQLVLPEQWQRSYLKFQNVSNNIMYVEFGSARAHATLTSGAVTAVTVDNGGFGFTLPPNVEFLGGGGGGNTTRVGTLDPFGPAPQEYGKPAQAHAVLTAGVVTSIVIDDPGSNYLVAPYVRLTNNPLDFIGCADPSLNSGTGCILYPGDWLTDEHMSVPTDQMAVFCATISSPFFCRYM
jgi:hypothetical protein